MCGLSTDLVWHDCAVRVDEIAVFCDKDEEDDEEEEKVAVLLVAAVGERMD